ncbi:MAG: LON peptidase substrate-binding domain-containing protein [Sterolibacteriaceae bacterium]|uniref:LON peptidase substrate-binding domain-containing protein n=1 Tax=Sulfuritalea sp. TaxID=2480090 RepID=UPI001A61EA11|nr:LON peptidase substrate-binding domain-containing protein [Sulfuritalea sp.]MBL8479656.1 LON peptidase substrate-binding domain-containing protein [Sterolibacteriaceae bacterium]MBN8474612.1 LON peptidase substrate-binding domain-containing protein [Sulfuritalea sp.]
MIVPLFPLGSVLFPGGRLPLRIFEQRYMDMAKACFKESGSFGVCLIAAGEEVARPGEKPAEPHSVGTLAHIADWDMQQLGVLDIVAQGGERFRLKRHWAEASGLLCGEVELIESPPVLPVPGSYARLVPLLRAIIDDLGAASGAPAAPHRFFDAGWLGMRYAEVLPIPLVARQKLLEIEDSIDRLEIIYRFLEGKGLLPEA